MTQTSTNTQPSQLVLGLPSGSLMEATLALFARAGWQIAVTNRTYRPSVDDPELDIRLLRAQEISRYVELGYLDCGITGRDWIIENASKVETLAELPYSKTTPRPTRWVLAVPENSPYKSPADLRGKRIATEAVGLARTYFQKIGIDVQIEFSWGSTEVKAPDLADAIIDVTETGSSLQANKLRILDTILESFPQFIANYTSLQNSWKNAKIKQIVLMLKGALQARTLVGLKMNLQVEKLKNLLDELPALRKPTVSPLSLEGWVAVESVIEERVVREILPRLKALGAEGIIEYPLNKVVQ
ncbi:MAG: ATP phosphoribosyltransferase [Chthoniobacterales bacterium]|nr:ATP phosphoribosyltransferase [Chthoniobacterales bacterium]